MSITPEQFREIIKEVVDESTRFGLISMNEKIDSVVSALDGTKQKTDNHEIELLSNQVVHDRFAGRIENIEKVAKITA